MKLYRDDPNAHISMSGSQRLRTRLRETITREQITHVIESGTYHGLGSTTFICEAFPPERPPNAFITMEVNWRSWRRASRNLRRFPFVTPVWGRTVPLEKALNFIADDPVLVHHADYPDIFIDDLRDPRAFYRNEVSGALGGWPKNPLNLLRRLRDRKSRYAGDDLLASFLSRHRHDRPLVVLDSSGGIGFLEFTVVEQTMRNHTYFLLLDDINHVKHFRSRLHVKSDPGFTMIDEDPREGWLLARHQPEDRARG